MNVTEKNQLISQTNLVVRAVPTDAEGRRRFSRRCRQEQSARPGADVVVEPDAAEASHAVERTERRILTRNDLIRRADGVHRNTVRRRQRRKQGLDLTVDGCAFEN